MYIKKVLDYDGYDANIIVTDGKYEIMCYAWEFYNKENADFELSAFDAVDVMRALNQQYMIEKLDYGYYSYKLQGKLIDLEKQIVEIGNIIIEVEGYLPSDIVQGEYIEFLATRIDFIEK